MRRHTIWVQGVGPGTRVVGISAHRGAFRANIYEKAPKRHLINRKQRVKENLRKPAFKVGFASLLVISAGFGCGACYSTTLIDELCLRAKSAMALSNSERGRLTRHRQAASDPLDDLDR